MPGSLDVSAAAKRWADTWKRAWEAKDTKAIVALYHPDVVFSTQPFRTPYQGRAGVREYLSQAFAEEEEAQVWMGEPVVGVDQAAVEWWAGLREHGVETTLAGTSVLGFDADGLVIEQRDAWNQAEGRRDPPQGWGR
jgi:hypothetical protein